MNAQQLQDLKRLIVFVAKYYGKTLEPEVVTMMAGDLQDLPFEEIKQAYEKYRRSDKLMRFPMPATIREMLDPEPSHEDIAREIASRITESITYFGWCNGEGARKYIGEIGWDLVRRRGGWMHLCQNHGVTIDPGMFEAQTRELAKVQIASGQNPNYGAALNAASYGHLKLVPQPQTPEEIEQRRELLLKQIDEIKKDEK